MSTNQLLTALAAEDRDRLSPFLTTIPMRLRLVLYKQDAAIDDVLISVQRRAVSDEDDGRWWDR